MYGQTWCEPLPHAAVVETKDRSVVDTAAVDAVFQKHLTWAVDGKPKVAPAGTPAISADVLAASKALLGDADMSSLFSNNNGGIDAAAKKAEAIPDPLFAPLLDELSTSTGNDADDASVAAVQPRFPRALALKLLLGLSREQQTLPVVAARLVADELRAESTVAGARFEAALAMLRAIEAVVADADPEVSEAVYTAVRAEIAKRPRTLLVHLLAVPSVDGRMDLWAPLVSECDFASRLLEGTAAEELSAEAFISLLVADPKDRAATCDQLREALLAKVSTEAVGATAEACVLLRRHFVAQSLHPMRLDILAAIGNIAADPSQAEVELPSLLKRVEAFNSAAASCNATAVSLTGRQDRFTGVPPGQRAALRKFLTVSVSDANKTGNALATTSAMWAVAPQFAALETLNGLCDAFFSKLTPAARNAMTDFTSLALSANPSLDLGSSVNWDWVLLRDTVASVIHGTPWFDDEDEATDNFAAFAKDLDAPLVLNTFIGPKPPADDHDARTLWVQSTGFTAVLLAFLCSPDAKAIRISNEWAKTAPLGYVLKQAKPAELALEMLVEKRKTPAAAPFMTLSHMWAPVFRAFGLDERIIDDTLIRLPGMVAGAVQGSAFLAAAAAPFPMAPWYMDSTHSKSVVSTPRSTPADRPPVTPPDPGTAVRDHLHRACRAAGQMLRIQASHTTTPNRGVLVVAEYVSAYMQRSDDATIASGRSSFDCARSWLFSLFDLFPLMHTIAKNDFTNKSDALATLGFTARDVENYVAALQTRVATKLPKPAAAAVWLSAARSAVLLKPANDPPAADFDGGAATTDAPADAPVSDEAKNTPVKQVPSKRNFAASPLAPTELADDVRLADALAHRAESVDLQATTPVATWVRLLWTAVDPRVFAFRSATGEPIDHFETLIAQSSTASGNLTRIGLAATIDATRNAIQEAQAKATRADAWWRMRKAAERMLANAFLTESTPHRARTARCVLFARQCITLAASSPRYAPLAGLQFLSVLRSSPLPDMPTMESRAAINQCEPALLGRECISNVVLMAERMLPASTAREAQSIASMVGMVLGEPGLRKAIEEALKRSTASGESQQPHPQSLTYLYESATATMKLETAWIDVTTRAVCKRMVAGLDGGTVQLQQGAFFAVRELRSIALPVKRTNEAIANITKHCITVLGDKAGAKPLLVLQGLLKSYTERAQMLHVAALWRISCLEQVGAQGAKVPVIGNHEDFKHLPLAARGLSGNAGDGQPTQHSVMAALMTSGRRRPNDRQRPAHGVLGQPPREHAGGEANNNASTQRGGQAQSEWKRGRSADRPSGRHDRQHRTEQNDSRHDGRGGNESNARGGDVRHDSYHDRRDRGPERNDRRYDRGDRREDRRPDGHDDRRGHGENRRDEPHQQHQQQGRHQTREEQRPSGGWERDQHQGGRGRDYNQQRGARPEPRDQDARQHNDNRDQPSEGGQREHHRGNRGGGGHRWGGRGGGHGRRN